MKRCTSVELYREYDKINIHQFALFYITPSFPKFLNNEVRLRQNLTDWLRVSLNQTTPYHILLSIAEAVKHSYKLDLNSPETARALFDFEKSGVSKEIFSLILELTIKINPQIITSVTGFDLLCEYKKTLSENLGIKTPLLLVPHVSPQIWASLLEKDSKQLNSLIELNLIGFDVAKIQENAENEGNFFGPLFNINDIHHDLLLKVLPLIPVGRITNDFEVDDLVRLNLAFTNVYSKLEMPQLQEFAEKITHIIQNVDSIEAQLFFRENNILVNTVLMALLENKAIAPEIVTAYKVVY